MYGIFNEVVDIINLIMSCVLGFVAGLSFKNNEFLFGFVFLVMSVIFLVISITENKDVESATGKQLTEDQIRIRAHQIWTERGCPDDQQDEIWYQAEKELNNNS